MSPAQTAVAAALVATVLAALIPVDRVDDQHIKSWIRSEWASYRMKLGAVHIVATAVLAAGATRIGWQPDPGDDVLTSVAHGVAWSAAALALLRAEFSGLRAVEATPGFSLLRAVSVYLTANAADDVENAVRSSLPVDAGKLHQAGTACRARAYPPRLDGTCSPDAAALKAAMKLFADADETEDLGELIVEVVTANKLPRCW